MSALSAPSAEAGAPEWVLAMLPAPSMHDVAPASDADADLVCPRCSGPTDIAGETCLSCDVATW